MRTQLLHVRYVGCISEQLNGYRFHYGTHSKRFSYKKYGGKDNAKRASEQYQKQFSDEHHLTENYHSSGANEHIRKYLIGFAEGDGCICVTKSGELQVSVSQAQNSGIPTVLQLFKNTYGGNISKPQISKTNKNKRMAYKWSCQGFNTLTILKDWINFGTLKHDQAIIAFEFLITTKNTNCTPIYEKLKAAKQLEAYRAVQINDAIITPQYIAGILDAEGCIQSQQSMCIALQIAQKSSINLLDSINNFFDELGHINDIAGTLTFSGDNAALVLKYLQPYIFWKKEQVHIALEIRQFPKHGRTDTQNQQLQLLRSQLHMLKKL